METPTIRRRPVPTPRASVTRSRTRMESEETSFRPLTVSSCAGEPADLTSHHSDFETESLNRYAPAFEPITASLDHISARQLCNVAKEAPVNITVVDGPKLDILSFDGTPERYPFFMAQVNEARHVQRFSDVKIIHHLKDRLKGAAFKAVHGALLSGASLSRILQILECRFGNPFTIITAVINRLLERRALDDGDILSMTEFCDEIQNSISILEAIGKESELNNFRMVRDLADKLPTDSQMAWGSFARRKVDAGEQLTCELFCEFLIGHIREREFGSCHDQGVPQRQNGKVAQNRTYKRTQNYATSQVNGDPSGDNTAGSRDKNLACFFCRENHWVFRCEKFRDLSIADRWAWVDKSGACVRCLSTGHQTTACRRTRPCGETGCQKEHHVLLHRREPHNPNIGSVMSETGSNSFVLMKTVVIELVGPKGRKRCVAYLDEGSSISLISENLAKEMGFSARPRHLRMKTMSGISSFESAQVDISVINTTNSKSFLIQDVYTLPSLELDREPVPVQKLRREFSSMSDLTIPISDEAPQLLIGLDQAELIAARQIRRIAKNGPILQETALGWTVTGRVVQTEESEGMPVHRISQASDTDRFLEASWETESFGCRYSFEKPRSSEDRTAERVLEQEVYHDGERWVAPLLRRDRAEVFPESRQMAEKRAEALERKLDSQEKNNTPPGRTNLAKMTYDRMEKMLQDGHFRKVDAEEASATQVNTWYLPLLAVQNPKKPEKVRLVLDAAAKSRGKSLNDFLLQGPDLINPIPGILSRWREKRIAVVSDVVAMFSQIRVHRKDLPSLRFLWREKRRTGPFETYESPVLIFGATCSPSIAEYCYRRTAEEFGDNPEVERVMKEDTYVDDVVTGAADEKEALKLTENLTRTLRKGGFELGPWTSNAAFDLKRSELEVGKEDDRKLSKITSVLGVKWNASLDVVTYDAVQPPTALTKRTLLSVIMAVYDPIGFLAGFLLRAKILLQRLWKEGTGWDDPLPDEAQSQFEEWLDELKEIVSVKIPRYLFGQEAGVEGVDLHAFCDASEDGFSAVLYYRWKNSNGKIEVSFVSAHSRVAPLKQLTIPRLELQAAVLACRMIDAVKKEARVCIRSTTCWSDSKNVLAWIKSTKRRFKVFVSNRIAEISDVTRPEEWRHVPTDLNVADAGSRGQKLEELALDGKWIRGPDFLKENEDAWPSSYITSTEVPAEDPEVKAVAATNVTSESTITEATPDPRRFSRWTVAVRTVAYVRRWLTKYRHKITGAFTTEELEEAENVWIRRVQNDSFHAELQNLRAGLPVGIRSKLSGLTTILVNDVICLDSRIKRSPELSPTAKFPPILPRDNWYTRLLIQHVHNMKGHRAQDAVLVQLRQKCWIPQAARTIRSVIASCQTCKNRKAKPHSAQMAPLPAPRVSMLGGAFRATGIDFFGPMKTTRGRATVKTWGVLFRCMATRAVHLELTDSLDTDATLMAISRFQARRGNVKELWSDNGRNFTSADRELRQCMQALDHDQMMTKLGIEGIQWRFIPPGDPEAGGVWERSIRTAKEILRSILKEQAPRYEVLQTLMCEVEKIMNSTPLFHVPVDASDDDVLTPYHFLIGRATPSYPAGAFPDEETCLRRRWRFAQTLANHFWRRWSREYLPTLDRRTKWLERVKNVKVGDIVIVVDPQHPRGMWIKGVVEEAIYGPDDVVRSARVRTAHGVLHRPVRKLVILDVIRSA